MSGTSAVAGYWKNYTLRAVIFLGLFFVPHTRASEASDAKDATILYGVTSRIRGFDPAKESDVDSALAMGNIYEGLLQYSYLKRPYQVEPCLAAALPDVSSNGCVYTFKIRPGIYFQDDACFTNSKGKGRELVAEDFVYSIKRVADLSVGSPGYWVFDGRIVGLDEFRAASGGDKPTNYDAPVEGLQAVDRTTLRICLTKPYPQFTWILAMQYAFAIPREAVKYYGEDFINHPVGTGAYRLKSWRRNYRLEYERSPKWAETGRVETYPSEAGEPDDVAEGLLKDAGRPLPLADGLVDYVMEDQTTQWLTFMNGDLESSGVSRENWDAVITTNKTLDAKLLARKIRLYTRPTLDVYYIGFNMNDPVVGPNKKLRQALSCCFNSDEWVKFWNGRVIRAKGPIPPNVGGYEEAPARYPFDEERAKALLAEAGFPGGVDPVTGKSLQLTVELGSANPQIRDAVELVATFAQRIGVVLKPSFNSWPSFLDKMERGQCQLYWLGWVADYPDAENFLQMFYGPNASPGPNHSNYKNPEFDALYDKIRVMPDSPERTVIYQQMAHIVEEDCPWIFMHHPVSYGLHHAWLKDYKPHDFPYGMSKYHTIDREIRSQVRELLRTVDAGE